MDYFIGNTKLMSPQQLRELNERTNAHGLVQTASHLTAIALCTYALAVNWTSIWLFPLFIIQGVLINFLYAGQHELSHWTVFKKRLPNSIFGHLFGFIVLMPRERDRMVHYQHHRFTQDPELDGELNGSPAFSFAGYYFYASGIGYWSEAIKRIFYGALDIQHPKYFNEKQKRITRIEAQIYLMLYVFVAFISWYFQSWAVVMYWLAPMFVTKFIHQCQNITEHTGMPNVPDILVNTRCIKTNRLLDWLAWNMPYHTAHHTFPAVPFHRLPGLHARMMSKMSHEPETIGYLCFQWHMFRKLLKEGTTLYNGKPIRDY